MTPSSQIEFSICICNRNMAETLRISLESILNQIDERFELVVVDDASHDNSLEIMSELESKYKNFTFYSLPRDKKRKLGFTRNISIAKANGEWAILHLDTDDYVENGIVEFVQSVLEVNSVDSKPALYSGEQIHMAPREWLLEIGPYRNLYRLEDRDLYQRLIPTGQWRIIKHEKFIRRLPRSRKKSFKKTLWDAFEHLISDTRYQETYLKAFALEVRRNSNGKKLLKLFRLVCFPFAYKKGRYLGIISTHGGDFSSQGVRIYRESNSRTPDDWVKFLKTSK